MRTSNSSLAQPHETETTPVFDSRKQSMGSSPHTLCFQPCYTPETTQKQNPQKPPSVSPSGPSFGKLRAQPPNRVSAISQLSQR
ncbi:hypothetical protein I3842_06G052800 [Carya illinoinensis]|uniref:Uncharacterized protein n=2 Tax=Carya illinoinensis TaxID=32201 RepID=A0A922EQ14_CARIL|nr:hypothetical protein I3842_06G052800 [Carya illinoinensis]